MKEKIKMPNLRKARKEKKLTQEQFGKKVGVSGKTIHHYEIGKRQPSLEMLLKMANALDKTVNDII
jgi:DNA-binding XRE family transcriptional regulator